MFNLYILTTLLLFSFLLLLFLFMAQSSRLINLLILLESMMLVALVYSFHCLFILNSPFLFLLLLSVAVVEAALGLSMVVCITRLYGNDFMNNLK